MSESNRRQQQPHHQPHQNYHYLEQHASQQYAQDSSYAHYTDASYEQQQQLYHAHAQLYPSTNTYTHTSASSSPYVQGVQSERMWPYMHHASAPGAVGYSAAQTAYPPGGGGYLTAADYAAASAHLSPSHLLSSSMLSGHSPRQSAGRSRLNNFIFPSQGASPSLESQVAHLDLNAGGGRFLPNQPVLPYADDTALGTNSGPTHLLNQKNVLFGQGEPRSDISLRYPPLPSVPERCATPSVLQSDTGKASLASETNGAAVDPSILEYVSYLRRMLSVYEKRDELLRLRTEAVGFQPKHAWSAWQAQQTCASFSDQDSSSPHPILGVRLLQRLDKLQRENDELGQLVLQRVESSGSGADDEVERLRAEVSDCHRLIEAMDTALSSAEAKAAASERALQVACMTNSTAILPADTSEVDAGQLRNGAASKETASAATVNSTQVGAGRSCSRNAATTRRASKSANSSTSNPNAGIKVSSQQQQRNTNKAANPSTAKSGTGTKTTRTDKSSAATSLNAKSAKIASSTKTK